MKNKIIASILTAIITLASFAFPVLAAISLGDYPTFLFKNGNLDAFVVVGAAAKPEDVVGGIDLAVRLAANSVVTKTLSGTASLGITGLDRDGIGIGVASGGSALDACSGCDYTNTFPSGNVVKNFHFNGLLDSTLTWRSNQYDISEQVNINGVMMRHDYSTTKVNGTLKMEVQSGDVIYEYLFEKTLTGIGGSSASGAGGPNYTYPVEIKMMGVPFTIVGAGTNQVRILQGSIGIASATSGVTYGDYTVYSDVGSSDSWARVLVKDKAGNLVETLTVNEGDQKDTTVAGVGLSVKLTDVKTIGNSGDVASANIVVGPTGTVEKLFDTTADTTSTGSASDKFPGTTEWGIRVAPGNFSTEGQITANDRLQVIYQPTTTQYLVAGEKVMLPNNYGELGFSGYGTGKFATVTVEPITSVSAYNSSGNVVGSNLNGFKISSDVSGSVLSLAGNGYDAGYLLFGPQNVVSGTTGFPVFVGFWDKANSRIRTADSVTTAASMGDVYHANSSAEYAWYNFTANGLNVSARYGFRVSYASAGEKTFWLNLTVAPNSSRLVTAFSTGDATLSVNLGAFQNKTVWGTSAPEFRLGTTAASAEALDLNATTEGSTVNIGTSTQDVVDDVGLVVVSPNSNSASDKVVVKYPSRELTARVYFGKGSGSTSTGSSSTYNEPLPVKTAVAKLDSEVSDPATVGKHLVLVGGPAVNKWTAEAMGLTFPTYGSSGLLPYKEGEGYVSLLDGKFKAGQVVVTVQGWDAKDSRNAASVLQQFDDFASQLKAQTAVKVTSVSAAGITPA